MSTRQAKRLASLLCVSLGLAPALRAEPAGKVRTEKADGYAEFREGDVLVVDGQRVRSAPGAKFKGKGEARDFASIPFGYEVEAKGTRAPDGALVATEIEAKPNGSALFEKEVKQMTDGAEAEYRKAGSFFEAAGNGKVQVIGRLQDSGPQVDRVRRIVDSLVPPYLAPDQVRVYVIDNPEWNAFAMGNYSVYVFSGLLDEMDDDEVAIVLGHELTHATHEHTRRQFKKQMWIQLAVLGVAAAAQDVDDKNKRAVIELLAVFGATAWKSGYGRDLEDQADRVGLRYAYEAGYDVTKGPRLWNRFAKRYGEGGKVANFFFGDHSLASARAANLERELALNYPDGPKPDTARRARRSPPAAPSAAERGRPAPPAAAERPAAAAALAGPAEAGRGGKKEIRIGMTAEEVRKLLGNPQDEVVFGNHSKWVYPALTVLFENGRVKDVTF